MELHPTADKPDWIGVDTGARQKGERWKKGGVLFSMLIGEWTLTHPESSPPSFFFFFLNFPFPLRVSTHSSMIYP